MEKLPVILASASPRRLDLLKRIGVRVEVIPPEIDETPEPEELPDDLVRRLASSKALAVAGQVPKNQDCLVLAADTVVVQENSILGKPSDREEASAMLRCLSGQVHQVVTGVAMVRALDREIVSVTRTTRVRFRTLSDSWIEWYLNTGEPFGKAGAYAIQGAGALLVDSIDGSWTNVVGLPLEILPDLAGRLDLSLLDLSGPNDQPIIPE
jgi:septum formation protein